MAINFVDVREKHLFCGNRAGKNDHTDHYFLKDYQWTSGGVDGADTLGGRKLTDFPTLQVEEYQPYVFSNYLGLLYDALRWTTTTKGDLSNGVDAYKNMIKQGKDLAFQTLSGGNLWGQLKETLQNYGDQAKKEMYASDMLLKYKDAGAKFNAVRDIPIGELSSIVFKEKICTYDLPWFTREGTLAVDLDSQLGSYSSLESYAGDRGVVTRVAAGLDTFLKFANDFIPVSLPPMFDWRFDHSSAQKPTVTNRFVLYNSTWDDLCRNFKFLNVLSSGAFWLQVDDIRYSSNLYRVSVPGRFDLDCCTLGIKVSYKGSSRSLPLDPAGNSPSIKKLYETAGVTPSEELAGKFTNFEGLDLFVPDMYVVELQFSSLLPQNFNTFLNMLINNQWQSIS